MKLFIDIETIPSQKAWVRDEIAKKITHPARMSKPETIKKWEEESKESEIEEKLLKTSFDGSVGEIICISYAVNDEKPKSIGRTLNGSEADLLEDFDDCIASAFQVLKTKPMWIGHNICEFDLRFLWQRYKVNKVKHAMMIPHAAKPWSNEVFDTYYEWSGSKSKGFGSLDSLCKIFGLKQKGNFDGSMVWDAVKNGEYDKVFDYCNDDVERVQELYKLIK